MSKLKPTRPVLLSQLFFCVDIGTIAPDISWTKGGARTKLSSLNGAENYVLVFWSSNCGHCLKELPALHKRLEKNSKIKVIAIGLENDTLSWEKEAAKLPGFEHAIALGKWKSEYAKLYDIHATPSYFILDADKRVIAKPESDKGVEGFLRNRRPIQQIASCFAIANATTPLSL